jgi:hypothetical protein
MTDAMDIDQPIPAPAPGNAMAAMMAASKKGKGKAELSQAEVDAKDKKDKEGLPWYVAFLLLHQLLALYDPFIETESIRRRRRMMFQGRELMTGSRNIDLFIWMMWFRIRISPLPVSFLSPVGVSELKGS